MRTEIYQRYGSKIIDGPPMIKKRHTEFALAKLGGDMIDKPDDSWWWLLQILLVSITGAIGGCGGAAHIFLSRNRPVRFMQFIAYVILGMMMSLLAFGLLSISNSIFNLGIHMPLEALVAFSMSWGFGGSLAMSGVNIAIRWTTMHFGNWDIKFTARQDNSDRRNNHGKNK